MEVGKVGNKTGAMGMSNGRNGCKLATLGIFQVISVNECTAVIMWHPMERYIKKMEGKCTGTQYFDF